MARHIVAMLLALAILLPVMFFYSSCSANPYGLEISDIVQAVLPGIALAAFASAYFLYSKWTSEVEGAWKLLSVAMLLWFLAYSIWAVLEITTRDLPYPSVSDLFWVVGYLFAIAGLALLYRTFYSGGFCFACISGAILLAGLATIAALLLPSVLAETNPLVAFLGIAYPAFDFIILALCIPLAAMAWGKPRALVWVTLAAGFMVLATADLSFSWLTFAGTYDYCSGSNFLFVAAYALLALGAYFRTIEK